MRKVKVKSHKRKTKKGVVPVVRHKRRVKGKKNYGMAYNVKNVKELDDYTLFLMKDDDEATKTTRDRAAKEYEGRLKKNYGSQRTVYVGGDTLLQMAKQLHDRGEITDEQWLEVQRRHADMNPASKKDVVIEKNFGSSCSIVPSVDRYRDIAKRQRMMSLRAKGVDLDRVARRRSVPLRFKDIDEWVEVLERKNYSSNFGPWTYKQYKWALGNLDRGEKVDLSKKIINEFDSGVRKKAKKNYKGVLPDEIDE